MVKKIRRSVGILSKLRHYIDLSILLKLYYALIYPFLIYGIIIWGNTYESTLKPIFILQKKALRTITFSQYDSPSSPLFKSLQVIKFYDLVTFHIATFMYKFHNQLLPTAFHSFFTKVTNIHKIYIIPDLQQNNLIIFLLLELITASLIFGFRVPLYGIVLIKT